MNSSTQYKQVALFYTFYMIYVLYDVYKFSFLEHL